MELFWETDVYCGRRKVTAYVVITVKDKKDYIEWKYTIIRDVVNTPPKLSSGSYYFRTVSNPIFSEYRRVFYNGVKKIVPHNLEELLTPLGLAVWIMDDGSRDKGCVRISSHNFSYSDHLKLQQILKAKFGISANIQRAQDKFWLWIRSESSPHLVRLIEPYVIPSMLYKLPRNDYSVLLGKEWNGSRIKSTTIRRYP